MTSSDTNSTRGRPTSTGQPVALPSTAQEPSLLKRELTTKDFHYPLPHDRIAHHPASPRDHSLLCHLPPVGSPESHYFYDLPDLLPAHSHLIVNDTSVFPARLFATLRAEPETHTPQRTVDLLLLTPPRPGLWTPFIGKPSKALRKVDHLYFPGGVQARVRLSPQDGELQLQFCSDLSSKELHQWLETTGHAPLPPYISRHPEEADKISYQTVYAHALLKGRGGVMGESESRDDKTQVPSASTISDHLDHHPHNSEGHSVAAPTAGLHLTPQLLKNLQDKNISLHKVRLHIGRGTFIPVRSEAPSDHVMHEESYEVPRSTYQALMTAHHAGEPIILVGTTTLRALESLWARAGGDLHAAVGWTGRPLRTDLFIYPKTTQDRYRPVIGQGMITNFHAPGSTLFMLICSLIGYDRAHKLYRYALRDPRYRFLSYGDSSLIYWPPAR